jgi:hypothetical protein
MTIAVPQIQSFYSGGSGTTIGVTATVAAGSYLHAFFTHEGNAGEITSVTSSPSLTWTPLDETEDLTNTQLCKHFISSVTSAGSITVTANLSVSRAFRGGAVKEITGSSGYDSAAAAHNGQFQASPGGSADAITSNATPTLTSQPALLSGFCAFSAAATLPSVGTGFTDDGDLSWTDVPGRGESKLVTVTTGAAATYTLNTGTHSHTVVAVFLEAASNPVIYSQPQSINVVNGTTATFFVGASPSSGSLSYQWQDDSSGSFANVSGGSGATTSTYTTAATTSTFQRRNYRCVVTDGGGSLNSASATLTLSWHDVYLYSMPEDADPDDVRLKDPTSTGSPVNVTGTFASTLAALGINFQGSVVNPGVFASTLGNVVAAFSGTVLLPTGTFASTLDAVAMSFSGAITNNGVFASTLGDIVAALAGTVVSSPTGTFASTLDNIVLSASGSVVNPGTFASTLADVVAAFNGTVVNPGTFAAVLGNMTASLSGTVTNPGTFASTLGNITMAFDGQVTSTDITGTFASTLGDVSMAFAGQVDAGAGGADHLRTQIGAGR